MTATTATAERLTLLMIEDSESDTEMILRHLARSGLAVTHERVDTGERMRAALAAGGWDAVLSDFNVPGFGAAAALAILQATRPDIPLIVVSGVILDEEALDLMRAGASDYVLKSNLARLAPALRREIAEASERRAHQQAQAALAVSRQRHDAAIESAIDGYAALDGAGRLLEVNDAMCALAGQGRERLLDLPFPDLLRFEATAGFADMAAQTRSAGRRSFEGRLNRPDGRVLDIAISITHRPIEAAEFFVFVHDISERRSREEALRGAARESDRARGALLSVLEDQRQVEDSLRESEERFRGMLEHNVSAVFVIEDRHFTYANSRASEILGYPLEELVGRPLLGLLLETDQASMRLAMDRLMSGEADRMERNFVAVRKDGTHADIGASGTRAMLRGKPVILGTAQDIGERKRAQQEIDRYITRLESAMQATLRAVSNMVELRDPYTSGHERRVGELAAAIGAELGLDGHVVTGLRLTGYVHDIGKISIPAEILSRPARLSATEFDLIKTHSQAGYDVLKDIDFPWPVAEVILQHHERLDGTGYPRGLSGDQILLESRITSVADVVEAMSSHRPYRAGLGMEAALSEIARGAGTAYDPGVAQACLRLFREKNYVMPL